MIDQIKEISIGNISEKGIEINNRCFTGEDGNQLIDPLKEAKNSNRELFRYNSTTSIISSEKN